MPVTATLVEGDIGGGIGDYDLTVPGFGQPDMAFVYCSIYSGDEDGNLLGGGNWGILAPGNNQCVSAWTLNSGGQQFRTSMDPGNVISIPDGINPVYATRASGSFITDGIRLNISQTGGAVRRVQALLIKAPGLQFNVVYQPNPVSGTINAGFEPDLVLPIANGLGAGISTSGFFKGAAVRDPQNPAVWKNACLSHGAIFNQITGGHNVRNNACMNFVTTTDVWNTRVDSTNGAGGVNIVTQGVPNLFCDVWWGFFKFPDDMKPDLGFFTTPTGAGNVVVPSQSADVIAFIAAFSDGLATANTFQATNGKSDVTVFGTPTDLMGHSNTHNLDVGGPRQASTRHDSVLPITLYDKTGVANLSYTGLPTMNPTDVSLPFTGNGVASQGWGLTFYPGTPPGTFNFYFGADQVDSVAFGATGASAVYYGTELVWSPGANPGPTPVFSEPYPSISFAQWPNESGVLSSTIVSGYLRISTTGAGDTLKGTGPIAVEIGETYEVTLFGEAATDPTYPRWLKIGNTALGGQYVNDQIAAASWNTTHTRQFVATTAEAFITVGSIPSVNATTGWSDVYVTKIS